MFFLNNNNDSIGQTSLMTKHLSIANNESSFFQSWVIGEDGQNSVRMLLFILVLGLHLTLKDSTLMEHSPEPPKMKIVEVELVTVQPPPAPTPPAPEPPKPEPPKPVPPKPKPTPPKPKPVVKPKPIEKPVVPDKFAMPVPAPVKAPPTPPVAYTPPSPPSPPRPATAPAKPAAPSGSNRASITARCVSSCGRPSYPSVARQRGWEGNVTVKVHIAKDGSVTSATVTSSSGYDVLDEAALDKVRDMEFNEIDENMIRTATQTIRFKLEN